MSQPEIKMEHNESQITEYYGILVINRAWNYFHGTDDSRPFPDLDSEELKLGYRHDKGPYNTDRLYKILSKFIADYGEPEMLTINRGPVWVDATEDDNARAKLKQLLEFMIPYRPFIQIRARQLPEAPTLDLFKAQTKLTRISLGVDLIHVNNVIKMLNELGTHYTAISIVNLAYHELSMNLLVPELIAFFNRCPRLDEVRLNCAHYQTANFSKLLETNYTMTYCDIDSRAPRRNGNIFCVVQRACLTIFLFNRSAFIKFPMDKYILRKIALLAFESRYEAQYLKEIDNKINPVAE